MDTPTDPRNPSRDKPKFDIIAMIDNGSVRDGNTGATKPSVSSAEHKRCD